VGFFLSVDLEDLNQIRCGPPDLVNKRTRRIIMELLVLGKLAAGDVIESAVVFSPYGSNTIAFYTFNIEGDSADITDRGTLSVSDAEVETKRLESSGSVDITERMDEIQSMYYGCCKRQ